MFSKLQAWLALADYEAAKDNATNEIIARFSRRNVSVQNGWHMDSQEIEEISKNGDRAIANVSKIIAKNQRHADHR